MTLDARNSFAVMHGHLLSHGTTLLAGAAASGARSFVPGGTGLHQSSPALSISGLEAGRRRCTEP